MKIAFLFNRQRTSQGDGIISQALTWKKLLESKGNTVDLINCWDYKDFNCYDIIQYFGVPINLLHDIEDMRMKNDNIVIAPICDPAKSICVYKIMSFIGRVKSPMLINNHFVLRSLKNKVKCCLVRSQFEKKYLEEAYGFNSNLCKVLMLSNGVKPLANFNANRENFCLHISRIGDDNKNVKRLIDASEKYKFRLVLAGALKDSEKSKFESWLKDKHYIEYLGFISESEKINLCSKAKVFALPSIVEGVGLSALEAATWGCDIVITNIGGPKEYYGSLAKCVNPYDIDDIGRSIRYFIDGNTFQPELSNYITENYSDLCMAEDLNLFYSGLLK